MDIQFSPQVMVFHFLGNFFLMKCLWGDTVDRCSEMEIINKLIVFFKPKYSGTLNQLCDLQLKVFGFFVKPNGVAGSSMQLLSCLE